MIVGYNRIDSIYENLNDELNDYNNNNNKAMEYEHKKKINIANASGIIRKNKKVIIKHIQNNKEYLKDLGLDLGKNIDTIIEEIENDNINNIDIINPTFDILEVIFSHYKDQKEKNPSFLDKLIHNIQNDEKDLDNKDEKNEY